MLPGLVRARPAAAAARRLAAAAHGETYNEPGGSLLHAEGQRTPKQRNLLRLYIAGFIIPTGIYMVLWQYRADETPAQWAHREAQRRMRERGFDASLFVYRPPDVYG